MARVKDYYWSIIAQEEIEYDEESGDEQWNHHTTSIVTDMYQNI